MKLPQRKFLAAFALASTTLSGAFAADIESFTEPYRSIDVAAVESGILIGVHVKEGQKVDKDQPLAELNQDVLRLSVEIAKTNSEAMSAIRAAEGELKLQTDRLARLQQLRAKDNATEDEVNRATLDREVAEARLLAAQENITVKRLEHDRIRLQLAQRTVRSPLNGFVTQLLRDVGESIGPNDPVVMTVVQLDPLLVTFPVPVAMTSGLKPGQTLKLKINGRTEPVEGSIELISPIINAESQTMRVKVTVANPENKFKSGSKCVLMLGTSGSEPPPKLTERLDPISKPKKQ